ncbi:hypothetical protein DH2020_008151 [Rehmannia glutinosa]|uniref:Uncharacterized protein n=1 Tax=Rehmannia glutinosa TaxID=99300 RepID=A0ABR0U090_REHGL
MWGESCCPAVILRVLRALVWIVEQSQIVSSSGRSKGVTGLSVEGYSLGFCEPWRGMQDPIIKRWCKPNNLIYGVQPALRLWRQQNDRVYDPIIASLGPYHHGEPELRDAEEDKYRCTCHDDASGCMLNLILHGERHKYCGVGEKHVELVGCVHASRYHAAGESNTLYGSKVVDRFAHGRFTETLKLMKLLRLFASVHGEPQPKTRTRPIRIAVSEIPDEKKHDMSFGHGSQSEGHSFRPSSSCSLSDITFDSHAFYGQLRLPLRHLNNQSQTFFCNAIAYEASPNRTGDTTVLSYVKFMKSLLQSSEDVKELRKRGILTNALGDNEQVVEMFRGIDTFDYSDVFKMSY